MSKKSQKFHNRYGEFPECSSCVTCYIRLDDTCTHMDDAEYCPNYISWVVCRACVLDSIYDDDDDLDLDVTYDVL